MAGYVAKSLTRRWNEALWFT